VDWPILREGPEMDSKQISSVTKIKNKIYEIEEVRTVGVGQSARIRGRLKNPPGWISMATGDYKEMWVEPEGRMDKLCGWWYSRTKPNPSAAAPTTPIPQPPQPESQEKRQALSDIFNLVLLTKWGSQTLNRVQRTRRTDHEYFPQELGTLVKKDDESWFGPSGMDSSDSGWDSSDSGWAHRTTNPGSDSGWAYFVKWVRQMGKNEGQFWFVSWDNGRFERVEENELETVEEARRKGIERLKTIDKVDESVYVSLVDLWSEKEICDDVAAEMRWLCSNKLLDPAIKKVTTECRFIKERIKTGRTDERTHGRTDKCQELKNIAKWIRTRMKENYKEIYEEERKRRERVKERERKWQTEQEEREEKKAETSRDYEWKHSQMN